MDATARPLCKCHGEPKYRSGFHRSGNAAWRCAVKHRECLARWRSTGSDRERAKERYHSDPEYRARYLRRLAAWKRKAYDPEKRWRKYIAQDRRRVLLEQRAQIVQRLEELDA